LLWEALSGAGDDGVSVKALMDATGKGRTWVYDRLRELAAAGQASPISRPRGYWRPVHHPSRVGHET
jgi:S-DNA-T family DNA segregation ATPase FtsK/SpoIIIE